MMNDTNIIPFPQAQIIPENVVPTPVNDEKIVLFQIVSPTTCLFLCLSVNEGNEKMEIGCLKK